MKRLASPVLSGSGESALGQYEYTLREQEDLASASVRNYLSDVRQFIAWYEMQAEEAERPDPTFTPQSIATPTLTRYRTYLQVTQQHKPASVNRSLISLKRYFGWARQDQLIMYDPSAAVKLVGQEVSPPRHLEDDEEEALVAVVTTQGTIRDRTLIVLLLHTGLRASEACGLRRDQVKLGKRSGFFEITGKRNKYREVPLNSTARKALEEYFTTLPSENTFIFPSSKTGRSLSERALGYIVQKYATAASLINVSPHDLRHRFGYRMAKSVPLHRLAQIMGHDSLDTTMLYICGTKQDLQQDVETIAWT
jgi:integrase/recombinase XerD